MYIDKAVVNCLRAKVIWSTNGNLKCEICVFQIKKDFFLH